MNIFPYETIASDKEFFGRETHISACHLFITFLIGNEERKRHINNSSGE